MSALFVADSFAKRFGRKAVLKSATVWSTPGKVTLVFGRNGSGKSTLLRCALGLMRADAGVVQYFGVSYRRPRLWHFASRGLFYLPDRGLFSRRMSFGEQLALLQRRFGVEGGEAVAEWLGVSGAMDMHAGEMSGGEERRCELTLAITRRPRCLIADEPLTEIEPKDRWATAQALRNMAREGTAVLLTGHEVGDLLEIADEVIWITAGTTQGLGTAAEAKAHGPFRREYLGAPAEERSP